MPGEVAVPHHIPNEGENFGSKCNNKGNLLEGDDGGSGSASSYTK